MMRAIRGRLVPALLILAAGVAAGPLSAGERETDGPSIRVLVDPRVELLSVIFRLAGNPEYGQGRVASYAADVEEHFGKFRDHPVVKTAADLRRRRGVSYDAVMGLAIHLTDAVSLEEAVPFEPRPEALDSRWTVEDARRFLVEARRFVAETDFHAFLEKQEPLYETAVARLKEVLDEDAGFGWFDRFFVARPGAKFTLALGMLNGPSCYGPRVRKGPGEEDLYCVLGVWSTDQEGLPSFDRSMLRTVAHEFCHSYTNPLVEKHRDDLEAAGTTIYPFVAEAMARQAYSNWETLMKESLVRACVVRYVRATRGPEAAAREIQEQVRRSFLWTPELSDLLGEYEASREEYPTLDAFMPRITAFFSKYAPVFAHERKRRAEAEPLVVGMTPGNGAADVDPGTRAIVVEFDRPMRDGCWSFVGGGPHFPETTGRPSYDRARKVITLPVRLEPNWRYEFWLNRGRFASFVSEKGVPLLPVHVTFRTGDAR